MTRADPDEFPCRNAHMIKLPLADSTTRKDVLDWLAAFAAHVRAVDYAPAQPMFHPDLTAFGTYRDVNPDLQAWIHLQWANVWPRTSDFRFDLDATHVLVSADGGMATAIAPWTSTGYYRDGATFERPGRATMVFNRDGDRWICVHSHMSLNRGVPQDSHADRPAKSEAVKVGEGSERR
jgi:ketosteroid isomerase-like protein